MCPGLWRLFSTPVFLSLSPHSQHRSLSPDLAWLWSLRRGGRKGMWGRGGCFISAGKGGKKRKSWSSNSSLYPALEGSLPWSPRLPHSNHPPQAFVSFSSWAPALRAQLPGKSAFSLAHGASSCARGLQRTWELAREAQLWSPVSEQPSENSGDGAQQSFLASSQVIWMHPECENHCLGKQLKTWAFHLASCQAQLEPPKLLARAVLSQGSGWGGGSGEELRLSSALWERQWQRGKEPTFTEHVVWGRHLASTGPFHN